MQTVRSTHLLAFDLGLELVETEAPTAPALAPTGGGVIAATRAAPRRRSGVANGALWRRVHVWRALLLARALVKRARSQGTRRRRCRGGDGGGGATLGAAAVAASRALAASVAATARRRAQPEVRHQPTEASR